MSGHTKGPWRIDETDPGTFEILGATNGFCADIVVSARFDNARDPRRIVACVNALEGLDPAAVADVVAALAPFAALADEVESVARACDTDANNVAKVCTWPDLERARTALASIRGEG